MFLRNLNRLALSCRRTGTTIERTITTAQHSNKMNAEQTKNQIHSSQKSFYYKWILIELTNFQVSKQ